MNNVSIMHIFFSSQIFCRLTRTLLQENIVVAHKINPIGNKINTDFCVGMWVSLDWCMKEDVCLFSMKGGFISVRKPLYVSALHLTGLLFAKRSWRCIYQLHVSLRPGGTIAEVWIIMGPHTLADWG